MDEIDCNTRWLLPDHLFMDEIVTKLPIKSLLDLLCVPYSSTIFRFILRKLFNDDHDHLVLVEFMDKTTQKYYNDFRYRWYTSFFLEEDNNNNNSPNLKLGFTVTHNYDKSHTNSPFYDYPCPCLTIHWSCTNFIGSVNGIIVYRFRESFHEGFGMWNPATDTFKRIDPSNRHYYGSDSFSCDDEVEHFGCAHSSKDYLKVVSIRSFTYDSGLLMYRELLEAGLLNEEEDEFFDANDDDAILCVDMDDDDDNFMDFSDNFMDLHSHVVEEANGGVNNIDERTGVLIPVRDRYRSPDFVVEVYSLSTDSWRRVKVDAQLFSQFHPSSKFYPQLGFNTNNTFSWLVRSWAQDNYSGGCWLPEKNDSGVNIVKLLSFNMLTEVFQVTCIPDAILLSISCIPEDPYHPRLFPIQLSNGTIAIVIPNLDKSFDMWLLLEYGVMDSWTRLCTIGPFPEEVCRVLGFWKNGKVFMELTSGEVVLADLTTNKIIQQNYQIQGYSGYSQIIPHKGIPFYLEEKGCRKTV